MEIVDSFGRKTIFDGTLLVEDSTDTEDRRKPQWLELSVWRTEGGSYVVLRATRYRIFHASDKCSRADGYDLVEAGEEDEYYCPTCAKNCGPTDEGFAQEARVTVDVYMSPPELIEGFRLDGRHNNLARSVLAEISGKDPAVDAAWNTVVVR